MKTSQAFLALTLLAALAAPCLGQEAVSTITFSSTRDNPTELFLDIAEIYAIDYLDDGTFGPARRLTENRAADIFPSFSPDGLGKILFDSNRRRVAGEPLNVSDLFLMNHAGEDQTFLLRGGSPAWAPIGPNGAASKTFAFHASASGTGTPVLVTPGSATSDSDIFVVNLDELLESGALPQNITNHPNVDDDPDWSNDGQKIVFTSHNANDDHMSALSTEIYTMNPDGSERTQITFNTEEERGPAWSPDGTLILFMCRRGDFEICVMNADGTGVTQLTENTRGDFTPSWSPDGTKILFHRALGAGLGNQLFVMNANGTGETQLTSGPGNNLLANWGEGKVDRRKSTE
jgi:TolB protein